MVYLVQLRTNLLVDADKNQHDTERSHGSLLRVDLVDVGHALRQVRHGNVVAVVVLELRRLVASALYLSTTIGWGCQHRFKWHLQESTSQRRRTQRATRATRRERESEPCTNESCRYSTDEGCDLERVCDCRRVEEFVLESMSRTHRGAERGSMASGIIKRVSQQRLGAHARAPSSPPPRRTGTFFCVTTQTVSSPRTANVVKEAPRTALNAYSTPGRAARYNEWVIDQGTEQQMRLARHAPTWYNLPCGEKMVICLSYPALSRPAMMVSTTATTRATREQQASKQPRYNKREIDGDERAWWEL